MSKMKTGDRRTLDREGYAGLCGFSVVVEHTHPTLMFVLEVIEKVLDLVSVCDAELQTDDILGERNRSVFIRPSEGSRRAFLQRSGGPPARPGSPPCPSSPGSSLSDPLAELCLRQRPPFPPQTPHMSTSLQTDACPAAPTCRSYLEPPSPAVAAPPAGKNRVRSMQEVCLCCE